jgi:predicted RNA-binding protein YlxR (DUF448 family)
LVRLALRREPAGARAVLDANATLPGRGAYLCRASDGEPAEQCLQLALKRGGLARALRCSVKIDFADPLESVGP